MPEKETEIFKGTIVVVRSNPGSFQAVEIGFDRAVSYTIEEDGVNSSIRCDAGLIEDVLQLNLRVEVYIIWSAELNKLIFADHLSGVKYNVPLQFGCWNLRTREAMYHIAIGKNMTMVEEIVRLCDQPLN